MAITNMILAQLLELYITESKQFSDKDNGQSQTQNKNIPSVIMQSTEMSYIKMNNKAFGKIIFYLMIIVEY